MTARLAALQTEHALRFMFSDRRSNLRAGSQSRTVLRQVVEDTQFITRSDLVFSQRLRTMLAVVQGFNLIARRLSGESLPPSGASSNSNRERLVSGWLQKPAGLATGARASEN